MNRNVQTFLACHAEYEEAGVVLFGAPFDGTTSYRPGARFGPAAIRAESEGIETYSPYSDRDLADISVFDGGDLELPFGSADRALARIGDYVSRLISDNKKFAMLGGEHLVTLGAVRALSERYPDLHLIQLDAHTDLRTEYLGETLSHATVVRQIWDLLGDGRIHQFGVRSGEKSEFEFAEKHTFLHKFDLEGFGAVAAELGSKPVYFTLDLDVLDPSVLSGTGTPEAGGVSFKELLGAVLELHRFNIVGSDICELSPHYDQSGSSTAAACKITREILLQIIS